MVFPVGASQIVGWAVTDQAADQVVTTSAGQVVTGTQVYFATEEGNQGSVFVPDDHYTIKKVHDSVEVRADLMDRVGRLVRGGIA